MHELMILADELLMDPEAALVFLKRIRATESLRHVVMVDEYAAFPGDVWEHLNKLHDEKVILMHGRQQGKSRLHELMIRMQEQMALELPKEPKQKAQWKQERGPFRAWGKR